jgi:hypothetical protein
MGKFDDELVYVREIQPRNTVGMRPRRFNGRLAA